MKITIEHEGATITIEGEQKAVEGAVQRLLNTKSQPAPITINSSGLSNTLISLVDD